MPGIPLASLGPVALLENAHKWAEAAAATGVAT